MLLAVWELHISISSDRLYMPVGTLLLSVIFISVMTAYFPSHLLGFIISFFISVLAVVLVSLITPFRKVWGIKSIFHKRDHKEQHNEHQKDSLQDKNSLQDKSTVDQLSSNNSLNSSSQTSSISDNKISLEKESSSTSQHTQEADVEVSSLLSRPKGRIYDLLVGILVLFYIPVLSGFLVLTLYLPSSPTAIIMAVFLPALSDTGGLTFGSLYGKHRIPQTISPKKSFEGLLGSFIFTTLGAYGFLWGGLGWTPWSSHWWEALLIGLIITITATFGDFCASLIKRDLGIKDLGHLLKGHGGILDRADSILISAPVMYALSLLLLH